MAYSSDEEDYLMSFFYSQFQSLFTPQPSATEALIRMCGDPERLERWNEIGPIFHMIRGGTSPPTNIPLENLLVLGTQLKAEGNCLYEGEHYQAAVELYSAAIQIGWSVLERRDTVVSQQRLSTFFANRAACYIKMGFLQRCVDDTQLAIKYNMDNVKAYYRKACALKTMGLYVRALEAAEQGRRQATSKRQEVKDFDSLIQEIHHAQVSSASAAGTQSSKSSAGGTKSPAAGTRLSQSTSSRSSASPATNSSAAGLPAVTLPASSSKTKSTSSTSKSAGSAAAAATCTGAAGGGRKSKKRSRKKKRETVQPAATKDSVSKQAVSVDDASSHSDSDVGLDSQLTKITVHGGAVHGSKSKSSQHQSTQSTAAVSSKKLSSAVKSAQTGSTKAGMTKKNKGEKQSADADSGNYVGKFSLLNRSDSGDDDEDDEDDDDDYDDDDKHKAVAMSKPSFVGSKPLNTALWDLPKSKSSVNELQLSSDVLPSCQPVSCHPQHVTHVNSSPAEIADQTNESSVMSAAAAAAATARVTFPLSQLFEAHVACSICFTDGRLVVAAKHSCRQDLLAVKSRQTGVWFRVRERTNHGNFAGKYHMCNQLPDYSIGKRCPRGNNCTFAHSVVERALWMAEKQGQFDIHEFITQTGNMSKVKARHSIQSVLANYPGQLAFLCRDCYLYSRRVSMQSPTKLSLCSVEAHDWSSSAVLAHCSKAAGNITLISQYSAAAGDTILCLMGSYCRRRWKGECALPHSIIERELWYVQRDCGLTQQQIVQQVQQVTSSQSAADGEREDDTKPVTSSASVNSSCDDIMSGVCVSSSSSSQSSSNGSAKVPSDKPRAPLKPCPYRVIEICSTCWTRSNSKDVITKSLKGDHCAKVGHPWIGVSFLILPCKKLLANLPPTIPRNMSFAVCWDLAKHKRCHRGSCTFAHCEEEIAVWKWMVQNKVRRREDVSAACVKPAAAASSSSSLSSSSSSVSRGKVVAAPAPATSAWTALPRSAAGNAAMSLFEDAGLSVGTFYCDYCNVFCNSESQLDAHCASAKHKLNINSDREHQWNFRPPPLTVADGQYTLCTRHEKRRCRYSDIAEGEPGNHCIHAHSADELDEWRNRFQWRQMKKQMAKDRQLYSYMDTLVDEIAAAGAAGDQPVISDSVPGVQLQCSGSLEFCALKKDASHVWIFNAISSGRKLVQVALVYDEHRLHFNLAAGTRNKTQSLPSNTQLLPGNMAILRSTAMETVYQVELQFSGGLFGHFTQMIVFDFGQRPLLARKVVAELGDLKIQERVQVLRDKLAFSRWTTDSCDIVHFSSETRQSHDGGLGEEVLSRYRTPTNVDDVVQQRTYTVEMNRNNYVHRMHDLLQLEEYTQAKIISEFNIHTTVRVMDSIQDEAFIIAQNNELFARVPLNGQLNEDTDAGHLVLWSVTSALLAGTEDARQRRMVYESLFVEHENYRGRTREHVCLRLSPRCCEKLNLQKNMDIDVEIQFQMNRLIFCQMHYAIDELDCIELLFPDHSKIMQPVATLSSQLPQVRGVTLNEDQMKIVDYVRTKKRHLAAPLVVYGAFGTGKTESLAASAILLASSNDVKLLICTQTNSAADEYIVRHFDKYVRSTGNASNLSVLRVYDPDRRTSTVNDVVKRYCLLAADGSSFLAPTCTDILHYKIIVTTLVTSLMLTRLGLRGHFTHIFIDEAAQVYECQALMPMSLAAESTCIVLAGDHLQMKQRVFSSEARELNFDKSIVERLFSCYDSVRRKHGAALSSVPIVQLKHNYRNDATILKFLSATFYGGVDVLVACSTQPAAPQLTPINFYAACGTEVQDESSTSWYNLAEVNEVIERVCELYELWPVEWGLPDARSILVTTAYSDQEKIIRQALRRRRLGAVTVLRVHNLPGMEFRAVFVSTVRSRHRVNPMAAGTCEFGFLSEAQLVNTALTRAKSWLAVVGDPVALCSLGNCGALWRSYLRHCEKVGGLHPADLSLEDIWQHSQSLTHLLSVNSLSADIADISPVKQPPVRQSQANGHMSATSETSATVSETVLETQLQQLALSSPYILSEMSVVDSEQQPTVDGSIDTKAKVTGTVTVSGANGSKACAKQATSTHRAQTLGRHVTSEDSSEDEKSCSSDESDGTVSTPPTTNIVSFTDWSLDYQLDADEIIRQLAKNIEDSRGIKEDEVIWPPPPPRPVDISHVELRERHGRVYLRYRRGAGYRHSSGDYDSVSDDSEDDTNDSVQYTELQLSALQASDPNVFKRCILNIVSSCNIYAKPFDHSFPKIMITARKLCGRAFHGDEVLVEIFDFGKKLDVPKSSLGSVVGNPGSNMAVTGLAGPWAKVVGVFKRAVDPKYRMFVCQVEEGNTGVMVPLNRGVPKIFNLERRDVQTKEGRVTVYGFTKAKQVILDHYQKVYDVNSVLFVVRYLKWEDQCSLPLGIVVTMLPPGVTVENTMAILDIEYAVPQKFCEATLAEGQLQHSGVLRQFPAVMLAERRDYRNKLVLTIDPANCYDLDDAVSFEVLPGGTAYLIGVHVADVSYFVTQASSIDNEARQRGASFYTAVHDSTPMLPPQLSYDLCSLLPNTDRLTLSVYIKVNASADILSVEIKRSIVRSHYQLCYSEAEAIINGMADESKYSADLTFAVVSLNRVAQLWRSRRLGREALYTAVSHSTLDGPKAHKLVEEMMLAANHQVATYLLSKFPSLTALQCQSPPDVTELEDWKMRFLTAAQHSVVFSRPYHAAGDVCQCLDLCECVATADAQSAADGFEMMLSLWPQIQRAFQDFDNDRLQSLVISPEFHPRQAVALLGYQLIQEQSVYRCGSELETDMERRHDSLNLSACVRFTSPLRHYIDIVTHRLLLCALNNTDSCYTQSDIKELCTRSTDVALRTQCYERANLVAHFCDLLMKRPLVLFAVVGRLSDTGFQLIFPTIQSFFPSPSVVKLSSLNTTSRAVIGSDSEYLLITWSQRIYDCRRADVVNRQRGVMEVNADQYTFVIPSELWADLLVATVDEDVESVADTVDQISSYVVLPQVDDPTSEGFEAVDGEQFVEYSLQLRVAGVVMVQLSTELHRGLLRPCVQLFHVTPSTCVCVEHVTAAVKCFCKVATKSAARSVYSSVTQYKNLWLPVLAMEAVHGAIANQHSVTIHHVDIKWTQYDVHGREPVCLAMLKLPVSFCEYRCITFAADEDDVDGSWRPDPGNDSCHGYMCVRYSGISMPVPPLDLPIDQLVNLAEQLTWVGHCIITKVLVDKDRLFFRIYLKVHQSSFPLPEQLLGTSAECATVEWIDKPLADRRMEQALKLLCDDNSLADCIAVGREPPVLAEDYLSVAVRSLNHDVPGLGAANAVQREAVTHALVHSFSLVQGPPGTGRIFTAVRLAALFIGINNSLPAKYERNDVRPQLLVCGPSNNSVDVIAGHLKSVSGPSVRLVRVYSQTAEYEDFSMPGHVTAYKTRARLADSVRDPTLQSISLHHLIRDGDNTAAQFIRSIDRRISRNRDDDNDDEFLTSEDQELYRAAIEEREKELLMTADVILCTCVEAGASRVMSSTNIVQVIIDECAMCKEAESLVPIVSCRPQQVVLFGDHKQLQPISLNKTAQSFGLNRSLFDRYASRAHMLTIHYRMHEALMSFPSQQFYDGRLSIGSQLQTKASTLDFWPAGPDAPTAFVHIEGVEQMLTVATDDGSEKSKSNVDEVLLVSYVVRSLVRRYGVESQQIAVLSQYRAQCSLISQQLQKQFSDVAVSTVVSAHGCEWDYVLLSTVRSLPQREIDAQPSDKWRAQNLGLITDEHQINVAITRARHGLIIVGNKNLLSCDPVWSRLLEDYDCRGMIVEASEFMS